jgi:hypothetical protein
VLRSKRVVLSSWRFDRYRGSPEERGRTLMKVFEPTTECESLLRGLTQDLPPSRS